MDTELEMAIFGIISSAGMAKSTYITAITLAKNGNISGARAEIIKGREVKAIAQENHLELMQREAQSITDAKDDFKISLLLVHAEDQMMGAETIEIMAKEIIDLYERVDK